MNVRNVPTIGNQDERISASQTGMPIQISLKDLEGFPQYALSQHQLVVNGEELDIKLIMREEKSVKKVITPASLQYNLFPNEDALSASDDLAKEIGAVPFDEFRGNWYATVGDHTLYNNKKTQMHALYAFNEPVDIGSGDRIQLGFAIHNSIDRSRGFGAGIFTFRHACANMMLHMGWRGSEMTFNDRYTIAWIYKRHTKELDHIKNNLKSRLRDLVDQGKEILATYRAMQEMKVTQEIAQKLAKVLPNKIIEQAIPEYDLKENKLRADNLNRYATFNNLTQASWHNPKTDMKVKLTQMNRIDRILVAPSIRGV